MTTALDIITRSLKDLGVLDSIEVPSADQSADGLVFLNDLIQSWANENLMINAITQYAFTATGAASYTMGAGGTWDTVTDAPPHIQSAFYTVNSVDYPIELCNIEEYNSIPSKNVTGTLPQVMCVVASYPLNVVYLWPQPSTGTVTIIADAVLTSLPLLTTVLSMPNGYERALRLCLSVEMMASYGLPSQNLVAMAMQAKAGIKRINHVSNILTSDVPVNNRRYNSYPRILWG